MPWQPTRHHRSGSLDVGEMSYAEWDQGQAVERPRDAESRVACGETEALSVAVTGEPDVQNPGGSHHHSGLTSCPGKLHPGIEEEVGHVQQQQPSEEKAEQHTRSDGGSAPPEQADPRYQRDDGGEIDQYLAPWHTLG